MFVLGLVYQNDLNLRVALVSGGQNCVHSRSKMILMYTVYCLIIIVYRLLVKDLVFLFH